MKKITATIALLGTFLLAGCSSDTAVTAGSAAEGDASMQTLRVATSGIYTESALRLGMENGFFEDQGLHIEIEQVPNPAAIMAAVQGGQADVAMVPSTVLLNGLAQGMDVKVVAAADGYGPLPEGTSEEADSDRMEETSLVATEASNVSRPRDLEGKTVAVPARKAQLEVTIAYAVAQDGGDPAAIEWVPLDFSSALSALKAERVDAAGLVMPFNRKAVEEGSHFVSALGRQFFGEISVQQWITSTPVASDKADALDGFREAIYKSNQYANENVDLALAKASEVVGLPEEAIKKDATPYWPTKHDVEDINSVADKLVGLGYLPSSPDTSELIWNP